MHCQQVPVWAASIFVYAYMVEMEKVVMKYLQCFGKFIIIIP